MAKRTTHRSSKGTKLYAVRDKSGKFKDIQTYKRAHSADMRRKSKAETAARKPSRQKPADPGKSGWKAGKVTSWSDFIFGTVVGVLITVLAFNIIDGWKTGAIWALASLIFIVAINVASRVYRWKAGKGEGRPRTAR